MLQVIFLGLIYFLFVFLSNLPTFEESIRFYHEKSVISPSFFQSPLVMRFF